jgi:hypothetical protein
LSAWLCGHAAATPLDPSTGQCWEWCGPPLRSRSRLGTTIDTTEEGRGT